MQVAINAFNTSMSRVRALHALYGVFAKQVTAVIDLSDVLRAEIVLAVSALDHFVHELARLGMLECWLGTRKSTDAFKRFPLPISVAGALSDPVFAQQTIETEIRSRHSFLAFQHPDRIADAVRLFSDVRLWDEVGNVLGVTAKEAKSSLVLIVERRNKIAHEADIDPSYPGQRWPIDTEIVENTLSTLEAIAQAIFKVVG
jgi:hypothetical protein